MNIERSAFAPISLEATAFNPLDRLSRPAALCRPRMTSFGQEQSVATYGWRSGEEQRDCQLAKKMATTHLLNSG